MLAVIPMSFLRPPELASRRREMGIQIQKIQYWIPAYAGMTNVVFNVTIKAPPFYCINYTCTE